MTRDIFKDLMHRIYVIYGDKFPMTQEKFDVWYEFFGDDDPDKMRRSIDAHANASQYAPTVADIRRGINEINDAEKKIIDRCWEIYRAIYSLGRTKESDEAFTQAMDKLPFDKKIRGAEVIREACRKEMQKELTDEEIQPLAEVIRRVAKL